MASQGLIINVSFDSSVNSAPAGFVTAVNSAVAALESIFTNPVTLNIDVGYGEVAGQTLGSDDLGESLANNVTDSYSAARSALIAEGAPGASTLPATSPLNGTLAMSQAEAKALGLMSATASGIDGYVGFSATQPFDYVAGTTPVSGQYDFSSVALHEITEVLGRFSWLGETGNYYTPMDLLRYTSSGVRDLTAGGSGSTAYFSIDNGATNLGTWNNNPNDGDTGDWYASGPAPGGNDSFDDQTNSGVTGQLSASDLTLMNALGWTTASTPSATTPTVSTTPIVSVIVGGAGINTMVFHGPTTQYAITQNSDGSMTIADSVPGRDGTDSLINVQQASFTDYTLVFDLHSSQDLLVYELYQAAYGQTPDNAGFRYWAGVADATQMSATGLADQFLAAPEFTQVYGAAPSNSTYVTELYTHVLGRTPDPSGLAYWIGQANAGLPHDQLMVDFATSAENVQRIGADVSDGYWTTVA